MLHSLQLQRLPLLQSSRPRLLQRPNQRSRRRSPLSPRRTNQRLLTMVRASSLMLLTTRPTEIAATHARTAAAEMTKMAREETTAKTEVRAVDVAVAAERDAEEATVAPREEVLQLRKREKTPNSESTTST